MNRTTRRAALGAVMLATSLIAGNAVAQAAEAQDGAAKLEEIKKKAEEVAKRTDGWKNKLDLGATGSANSSSNVVGSTDGATYQIGVVLLGEAKLKRGQHGWDNELKVQHAQTRTPVIDGFVKSADSLDAVSTYTFHVESTPWLGPYGRLKLNTQVLSGYDVRAEKISVVRTDLDGTTRTSETPVGESTNITGMFEPLVLTESAGLFMHPFEDKAFILHSKLGAAMQHIVVRDGYAVKGYDAPTTTLSLQQLETAHQAGAELELDVKGQLTEQVGWGAKANFFYPLYSTAETKFEGLDALNTDLSGKVSVKLARWASLDYVVSIKRIPLILDDWQVQHGLLLSTAFSLL